MFYEEWPLMTFTVLSQLAIGTYIVLWLIHEMNHKSQKGSVPPSVMKKGLLAVAFIMGLSLLFSLFHLGTPSGAYRSIFNFTSSWLSREIIFAGVFFIMAAANFYYFKKKQTFQRIFALLTALIGLIAVFSMASLYSASIRPAWDNIYTFITFFGTTLFMGIMSSIFIVSLGFKEQSSMSVFQGIVKRCCIIAAIIMIAQLAYLPVFLSSLSSGGAVSELSMQLLTGNYAILFAVKWILGIIGTLLLIYVMRGKKIPAVMSSIPLIAFLLVVAGESIGRYVFYGIGVSIGIG